MNKFIGVNQLIPHLKKTDIKLHQALNNISDAIVAVNATVNGLGTAVSTPTGAVIYLNIPGVFGIQSNATPLAVAPAVVNWTSIVAIVKQAPVGAAITMILKFSGAAVATFSITDGNTQVVDNFKASNKAGDIITLDITSVGLTFPGSDLTVQLQS